MSNVDEYTANVIATLEQHRRDLASALAVVEQERDQLQEALDATSLYRDALVRIGGLDARGLEGFHNVGDESHPDQCPGCWAWRGLLGTVRPDQDALAALAVPSSEPAGAPEA